jgi:hypothetical protein
VVDHGRTDSHSDLQTVLPMAPFDPEAPPPGRNGTPAMNRKWKYLLAALCVSAFVLTSSTTASPTKTKLSHSESQALELIEAATLPVGSTRVNNLPGTEFTKPGISPGCARLVDKARYWKSPGTPATVAVFLKKHPPAWAPTEQTGTSGSGSLITSYIVSDSPDMGGWARSDMLVFVVAGLAHGGTGIRVDAEVVPKGAPCETHGVAPQS